MSSSVLVTSTSDEQRWTEWLNRGLERDRRSVAAMQWVMAIVAIMLGALFGTLL
jgi:hypothetical protein